MQQESAHSLSTPKTLVSWRTEQQGYDFVYRKTAFPLLCCGASSVSTIRCLGILLNKDANTLVSNLTDLYMGKVKLCIRLGHPNEEVASSRRTRAIPRRLLRGSLAQLVHALSWPEAP